MGSKTPIGLQASVLYVVLPLAFRSSALTEHLFKTS